MENWADYERRILAIFQSTGFLCERDVLLSGARGTHRVDIVVRASAGGSEHLWLVECKNHRKSVEKRDLLTFKGVIDDLGADHGFLVSESGFQAGTLDMGNYANLTLCSALELESRFRAWQLQSTFEQSKQYRVDQQIREDDGNSGPGTTVILRPGAGRVVASDIIEIIVRKDELEWVIGREQAFRMIYSDGCLHLNLPWNLPHSET